MNTDNVYIVVLLVIGIVVLSNVAMFAMVRGSKNTRFDWLKTANTFTEPFRKSGSELDELHQRVGNLQGEQRSDEEDVSKG